MTDTYKPFLGFEPAAVDQAEYGRGRRGKAESAYPRGPRNGHKIFLLYNTTILSR